MYKVWKYDNQSCDNKKSVSKIEYRLNDKCMPRTLLFPKFLLQKLIIASLVDKYIKQWCLRRIKVPKNRKGRPRTRRSQGEFRIFIGFSNKSRHSTHQQLFTFCSIDYSLNAHFAYFSVQYEYFLVSSYRRIQRIVAQFNTFLIADAVYARIIKPVCLAQNGTCSLYTYWLEPPYPPSPYLCVRCLC